MAVKVKKQNAQSAAAGNEPATKTTDTKEEKKPINEEKEPVKKEKSEKRQKRSAAFSERIRCAVDLMAQQKFTDEEIKEKVAAKFPDYPGKGFDQKEMGRTRWMLRWGMVKGYDAKDKCHDRIFEIDGKRYARADRPKKSRTKKEKVSKENDPLMSAGVNVHDGEKAKKAEEEKKERKIKKQKHE